MLFALWRANNYLNNKMNVIVYCGCYTKHNYDSYFSLSNEFIRSLVINF